MSPELAQPWAGFLGELDALLDTNVALHCMGGFAVVAAYGLPRGTNDLDYYCVIPNCMEELERMAGEGSALHSKYNVYIHHAGIASLPEGYTDRLLEPFAGRFHHLRLLLLDPYDLVLSKISRNGERDREDVRYLARTQHLDPAILRSRYERELRANLTGRPEWHDQTLVFWLEAYFAKSGT